MLHLSPQTLAIHENPVFLETFKNTNLPRVVPEIANNAGAAHWLIIPIVGISPVLVLAHNMTFGRGYRQFDIKPIRTTTLAKPA